MDLILCNDTSRESKNWDSLSDFKLIFPTIFQFTVLVTYFWSYIQKIPWNVNDEILLQLKPVVLIGIFRHELTYGLTILVSIGIISWEF